MGYKLVNLVMPLEEEDLIQFSASRIPSYEKTIYDAVGFFEDEIFLKSKFKCEKTKVKEHVLLRDIINLHDEDGLDIEKIKNMTSYLDSKKHIFSESGIPNIKLIRLESKEWVVFDGHHTLNSYLFCNKKYLCQVPHIIIESKTGLFRDEAIKSFFGKHSKKLKGKNWRDYVVNWNASLNNQLCIRKRRNIGEVFDSLKALARNPTMSRI